MHIKFIPFECLDKFKYYYVYDVNGIWKNTVIRYSFANERWVDVIPDIAKFDFRFLYSLDPPNLSSELLLYYQAYMIQFHIGHYFIWV